MGNLVRCTLFTNKARSRLVSDTSADRVRHSRPTYPSLFRQLLMLDETPASAALRLTGTSWCWAEPAPLAVTFYSLYLSSFRVPSYRCYEFDLEENTKQCIWVFIYLLTIYVYKIQVSMHTFQFHDTGLRHL